MCNSFCNYCGDWKVSGKYRIEGGWSYSQLSQGLLQITSEDIYLGDNINSVVLSFAERSSSRRF